MGKWEMVRLGEVIEKPQSGEWGNADETGNGFSVLRTTNFTDEGVIDYKNVVTRDISAKKFEKKALKYGDIIIEKSGGSDTKPVGRVVYYDRCSGQYIYNNFTAVFRVKAKSINCRYLFFTLFYNYRSGATVKYENKTTGIHNLRLNDFLEGVYIPCPSLDEQKRIAKNLDLASEIAKGCKEQLAELDKLVQSLFNEMFGDPVTNERGWEKGIIRDVVTDVKYGTSKPAIDGGKYKYLRMGNITYSGHLDLSDLKYIDISDNDLEKYVVRNGDVLFNRTNSKELVGKTCVFNVDEPMIVAGYIIRVRTNQLALPIYLSMFLNSSYGKKTLESMCKSIIGQANINAQELQNISILIPPIPLQTRFAEIVTAIEAQKAQVQQALAEAENLFNSLMQEYFA